MCFYLVYLSFPLIDIVGAVTLVITPLGACESKAQMIAPCGGVRAVVPFILEVTPCPQRLVCNPRNYSGLLLGKSLVWACSYEGHWLRLVPWSSCFRPGPAEVVGLGLL